ncbi:MAG: hypothetical protein GXP35_05570 [Actinobacteria bacterium]|nr:hypothetical protein [Actinomycetota bacterium]
MSKTGTKSKKSTDSALTVSGPQPVWMTLNEARERAFTGEIVFEVEPEVLAYLDNGVVYYAERSTDASLGRRLVETGVLDSSQLERGTVRVGDVEHLGRLFGRDPSVDRDAVLVVAEAETEALISQLANESITTARVTAYRHHPSGVHRWFVAPIEPAASPRPIGEVAQLDTTVVDDLPGLPVASVSDSGDELTIEWEESLDGFEELEPLPGIDEFDASMLEAMLDGSGGDLDVEIISDTPKDGIADWDESVEALLDFSTESNSADVVQIDPEVPVADTDQNIPLATEPEADLWIEVHDDLAHNDGEPWRDTFKDLEVEDLVVDEPIEPVADEALIAAEEIVFYDPGPEAVVVEDTDVEDFVIEDVLVEDTVDEVVEIAADEAAVDVVVADTTTTVDNEESVWDADTSDDVIDREFQVVWPDDVDDVPATSGDFVDSGDSVDVGDSVDEEPIVPDNGEVPIIQTTADGLYFEMPPLNLTDEPTTDEDVPDGVADAVRRAIAAIESAAVGSASIAPIADAGPGDDEASEATAAADRGVFAPPSIDTSAEVLYSQWEDAATETAAVPESGDMSVESGDSPIGPSEDGADERSSALRRLIGSLRRKDR